MKVSFSNPPGGSGSFVHWQHNGTGVTINFPDWVHAMYSKVRDLVITISGDGKIRVYEPTGNKVDEFYYSSGSDHEYYALMPSRKTKSGVAVVMGYDTDVDGDTFWQHDLDLDNRRIGKERIARWR